ncbi:hypothetical protein LAWI1_G002588 [Lachnellula willkommii]|uniref:DUF427 domain-containing protein n=1 Tax=Lachnellula willkommii TaxID=215461 RepID=A0A559MF88_9HELO|nr:hypothetical protein LAWI1_G002588 [Lachnellula willkommii]
MADLEALATNLASSGPRKVESTPRRVRALFDGVWVFDTTSSRHVWEHQYFPQFWVPIGAVSPGVLTKGDAFDTDASAFRAVAKGKDKTTERVLVFEKGPLAGLVRFEFKAMDAWFEEDQQIYDHPKNPYTRIDILPSSRKITVKIGGVTIAESLNPMFLFETGLRTRFYLPKTSVQWQFLSPSQTTSKCPYKGLANYYNVTLPDGKEYKDTIWWYEYPTTESSAIQGLVCFYNEKVDTYIDGVLEEK